MLVKRILFIVLFSVYFLLTNGCGKDDILEPQEDHFEAEGMVFYSSGIKLAEIFRGVTSDTLRAKVGLLSELIEIKFLNPERQEIAPPDYKKQPLTWEITDTSIVSIKQHEGKEGSYEFLLWGKKEGVTKIEFFILHEGHPDFRSGKIPIKVEN